MYGPKEPAGELDSLIDIHRGLKNKEFVVHYQPIVSMDLQHIFGVEALVRWQHLEHGLLAPYRFIPTAEGSYIISHLGHFVLRQACEDIQSWNAAGNPIALHVNVSLRQFMDKGFADSIALILQETDFQPELLYLELTETLAIRDVANLLRTMEQLIHLGVQLSLDDFGMEYSTFQWLKDIPYFSSLKLDMSYIQQVHTDRRKTIIVKSILSLAQELGLQVIAEGIESKDEADFLQQHGCTAFQGFLYSPAIPLAELEERLVERQMGFPNPLIPRAQHQPNLRKTRASRVDEVGRTSR